MSDWLPDPGELLGIIGDAVTDALASALGALPDMLQGLLDSALSSVNNAVDRAADAVQNAIDSAAQTANHAIDAGQQVADHAIDGAVNVANNAINRAADSVDNAIDQAAGIALTAVNQAANVANNAVDAADRRIGQAIDRAANSVDNAIDQAAGIASNAVNRAANSVDNAVGVADRRIGQMIEVGERSLNKVADSVKDGLQLVGDGIEHAINAAVDFASHGLDVSIGSAGRWVGDAINRASSFVGNAVDSARQFIAELSSNISRGINDALAMLAAAEEAARQMAAAIYNDGLRYAEELWGRLKRYSEGKISEGWSFISNLWEQYMSGIADDASNMATTIEAIGAKLFTCGYDNYASVISDIASIGVDSSLIKVLVLGVLAAGVVMSGAPVAAQPYLQCIANIGLNEVRPMSADLATLAAAAFRGLPGGSAFEEAAGRQGVPNDHASAYIAMARNPMPVGQTIEALLRGIIDVNTASGQLVDAQYDPALLSQFVGNARPLLSAADAFMAARRGGMTIEEATAEATRAGWTSDRQAAIQRLVDQLLTADQYVSLWLREELTDEQLGQVLTERGYPSREQEMIKKLAFFVPPPSDLIRMSLKDVWNDQIVDTFGLMEDFPPEFAHYAKMQGIDDFWAHKYWAMAWDYPSNTQGFEMYQRGFITKEELELLLKTNDVPPFWRDRLIKLNYNPLTRTDVRRMYQLGVLDEQAVTRAYLNIGYSPEDAQALTEFTKRMSADANKSEADELKQLTRSQIEQAYIRGIFSEAAALAALKELRYDERDARLILQLALARNSNDAAAQRYKTHNERIIRLIIGAYGKRTIDGTTAKDMLIDVGLDAGEVQRELDLADLENGLVQRDDLIDNAGKLFVRRIFPPDTTRDLLDTIGVSVPQREQLLETWQIQKELRADMPTRTDLRRWLKNGMITLEEYADELRGMGYAEKYVVLYVLEDSGGTEA